MIGYLFGSIPTGVWVGKIFRGIDIREQGSKSTGATNVYRVLGIRLAIVVLLIDIAKGFFAAYLGSKIYLGDTLLSPNQLAMIAGILAIVGHLFPLFAGFHGGKGVATGAGMLLFLAPLEVAFALVIFIVTVALTRYVSLGSILAALFFALSILIQKYLSHYPLGNEIIGLSLLILVLILYTHRANIRRLIQGTENKLGAKKT
ncbi:MAG TPA: acyl-phosphate glycerol 3-phosphate acyltransferase [candidate division Zixibacteria bacterium]|nr:acyl-phosphate glycerol 3-phosphate acyltransferase [candidate division Zixibacteria bacterium]